MKNALKWTGITVLGLVVVLLSGGIAASSIGTSKANKTYEVTATLLDSVPQDSASLAYGEHLAKIHGCASCHSDSFEGKVFIDAPPFLVAATNLTAGNGGIGTSYTIQDWDRSIRYGVGPDGKALIIMPSKTLHNLSDTDAAALIGYLSNLPPINSELPETELRPLGKVLTAVGEFDVANEVHLAAQRESSPPASVSASYGKYLSSMTCTYCHGDNLEGGAPLAPDEPPPPSLIPAGKWNAEMFKKAMRTGITPTGHEMNIDIMPWNAFKHMTDEELQAIHLYLQSL